MKTIVAVTGLSLTLLLTPWPTRASDQPDAAAATARLQAGVKTLEDVINAKIKANTITEADLAPELKQLDALLAGNQAASPEAAADVLEIKIEIYHELFDDPERAIGVFKQIKADYPTTPWARAADEQIKDLTADAETGKIARALKPGVMFPPFAEKDLDGKPLTLAGLKGQVVLVDFWATWCPPCMVELPNVLTTDQKYHDHGFAIVGVSLDDAETKAALTAMLKDKGMAWPVFYDGQKFENKLAVQYGVHDIPTNYLLDGTGKIIGKNLRGPALEQAVAAAK